MTPRGNYSLIGALILTTLLWGSAVAAHQHVEIHQDFCEICLLPHTADVAPAAFEIPRVSPARQRAELFTPARPAAPFTAYRSRAPPR